MKKLGLCVMLLLFVTGINAQTPAKIRQGVRATAGAGAKRSAALARARQATAGGLPRTLSTRVTTQVLQKQARQTSTRAARPWLVQKLRDYKAYRIKHTRRERDAKEQAQKALRDALPPLVPEKSFEVQDFAQHLTQEIPDEPLPLLSETGTLYRGLALPADGAAVKNILQNGLRVQDLGSHATTKLLALSGGMRGAVSSTRPVTNLTSFPQDALYWATQRATDDNPLLAVVVVKGQTQAGRIVLYSDDIPAGQIAQILVPLQVDGVPAWCEVSLTPQEDFLVIPYQSLAQTQDGQK